MHNTTFAAEGIPLPSTVKAYTLPQTF